MQVVCCAVQRINNPLEIVFSLLSSFFRENRVFWVMIAYDLDYNFLCEVIDFCYVFVCFLFSHLYRVQPI